MRKKWVGLLLVISALGICPVSEARGYNQSLIPPPPPTPVMAVPPTPVLLPYSEAYAGYGQPPTPISQADLHALPFSLDQRMAPQAVRRQPNFIGLSLTAAAAKGFGKPRVPYNVGYGSGAAFAAPVSASSASTAWFDPALRWYSEHSNARNYYAMAAQSTPYKVEETNAGLTVHAKRPAHRKRVIASR